MTERYWLGMAGRVFLAGVLIALGDAARAAKIGLDPLMGDGAAGRVTTLSGVYFEPSTTYNVLVGGLAPTPATVVSNGTGAILPAALVLPAFPAGNLNVLISGTGLSRTFTGAYRVWRNICLNPVQGDGRAGQTWQTNGAIPTGGWTGMVFLLEGTGFAASATIPADSITVGGASTDHPQIVTSYDGRLPSTTIIVQSGLSNGRKDIVVNDGAVTAFAGAYEVRRVIGMNPARGCRQIGTTIFIEGWGFADGAIAANSIQIGTVTTSHAAAAVTNGHFQVTASLDATLGAGVYGVVIDDGTVTTFPGTFHAVGANARHVAISPQISSGMMNQACLVEGTANWSTGQMGVNSIIMRDTSSGVNTATVHPAINVANGRFPATWIMAAANYQNETSRMRIPDPVAGIQNTDCIGVYRTLGICPLYSAGYAGWTVSLTGWAFEEGAPNPSIAANSITLGGVATTHAAVNMGPRGTFGPIPVTVSQPLSNGGKNVVINDDGAGSATFANAISARRTIGLSFVVGPGSAGEFTVLSGSGFTASSVMGANSITFNGTAVSHPAINVGADGSFAATALALPVMNGGAYDVNAQEVFPGAYRVANPLVEISKFRDPGRGVATQITTFSFSFTNAQYVGDPGALGFVLRDNLPPLVKYVALSSTCYPPALTEWYDGGAWTAVEPAPAGVTAIRWTLLNRLPAGASGWARFQVSVQ